MEKSALRRELKPGTIFRYVTANTLRSQDLWRVPYPGEWAVYRSYDHHPRTPAKYLHESTLSDEPDYTCKVLVIWEPDTEPEFNEYGEVGP